jgi:hypothetical protein
MARFAIARNSTLALIGDEIHRFTLAQLVALIRVEDDAPSVAFLCEMIQEHMASFSGGTAAPSVFA